MFELSGILCGALCSNEADKQDVGYNVGRDNYCCSRVNYIDYNGRESICVDTEDCLANVVLDPIAYDYSDIRSHSVV